MAYDGTAPQISSLSGSGNINGAPNPGLGLTTGNVAINGLTYDNKYATYLKVFSGEMFKAYETALIAKDTVQNRTLRNAKSAQFIYTGRMAASYHTPGTPILGDQNLPVAEKTIIMDDLLVSSSFVYDLTRLLLTTP